MVFAAALAFSPVCLSASTNLPSPQTSTGFVAHLLVNETPFPGEKNYRSEEDTMRAMDSVLNVLVARLVHVPPPYRQSDVATVTTTRIVDVIAAGGVRGQVDGFYRDQSGTLRTVSRVTDRVSHLENIANQGAPGRFARLLNYATSLSARYNNQSVVPKDLFVPLSPIDGIPVTGRAYSWMTDQPVFHPGGNYMRIPNAQHGSLGGNRFFTLRVLTR